MTMPEDKDRSKLLVTCDRCGKEELVPWPEVVIWMRRHPLECPKRKL